MGRYYSGDIEGKFMFAIQSSDAASRFGGEEGQPQYIDYYFGTEHLDEINTEIKKIETYLGDKIKIIKDLFESSSLFNSGTIIDLGLSTKDISEYADLRLGIQIRDYVLENKHCYFQAEI
jgi:hypothetical protein